jgi:3-oxoacyl-[acyl-carrier-protein] synthase II
MQRRVAITGLGIVSTFGNEVGKLWDAVLAGQTGGSEVALDGLPTLPGVRVLEFDADEVIGKREARRMDRVGIFAAVAAAQALADAGQHGIEPERIGTAIGCAHGGAGTVEETQRTLLERGLDRVSPFAIPLGLVNSPVAGTARLHNLKGPSAAPATACAAGSDAIGWAYERVRDGRADAMVAGGAEAALVPSVLAGYVRLGAIASLAHGAAAASRPFDTARDGFVMAEGAGVLVLEEWEHALARGAHIYGEVVGYGQSCDAGHLTSPDETGEGPARAVQAALDDAGLTAAAIGYVNAHATSTPVGDTAEARVV